MLKVVLDTNLLINGSQDDFNYCNRIIDAVIEGKLAAFANRSTLRENQLLSRQKIQDPEYLKKLRIFFDKINYVENLPEKLNVVFDPQDNKLVESAVAAGADFLVSADHHLLDLGEFRGVKICSPEVFWSRYEETTGGAWQAWLKNFIK